MAILSFLITCHYLSNGGGRVLSEVEGNFEKTADYIIVRNELEFWKLF